MTQSRIWVEFNCNIILQTTIWRSHTESLKWFDRNFAINKKFSRTFVNFNISEDSKYSSYVWNCSLFYWLHFHYDVCAWILFCVGMLALISYFWLFEFLGWLYFLLSWLVVFAEGGTWPLNILALAWNRSFWERSRFGGAITDLDEGGGKHDCEHFLS